MVAPADARLSAARAAIARAALDALPDAQLGDITLHAAQRRTVARAERALRTRGGCLVGEDVGRGKTFVALALARQWQHPLVLAPAALRSTWGVAQARAGVPCEFISHESLSRRRLPAHASDMLIIDESHHFRNPATVRYEVLVQLAARLPIVLLSATPLQNQARDLAAQVALFHGEAAWQLPLESLARFVIRGEDTGGDDLPHVATPEWIPVAADDGPVLEALLDLPSPPRPHDGGDAGALRTIALVRAWASSRAALRGMLRSRRRIAAAIANGVEAGRTPSRRETREWRAAEDVVQLGLAAMLMQRTSEADSLLGVRASLDDEDAGHHRVRAALASTVDPDVSRVAAIRMLRAEYPDSRIVAFSEYARTVSAYFDTLRNDPGVGALTARHSRIATGVIARAELLARFAPHAQGAREFAPHQAVTLLLATDLISEGVNLQDASIVLHLDLPWNPAKLAQRVGRVRRPGGAQIVRSFLLAPPVRADVLLAADARLRRKLDQARVVVGAGFAVLPTPSAGFAATSHATDSHLDNAAAEGRLINVLQRWGAEFHSAPSNRGVVIGAAIHHASGWLAALDDGRLIGALGGAPSESVADMLTLTDIASGAARSAPDHEVQRARDQLRVWLVAEELLKSCGVTGEVGLLHRRAHALLGHIIASARRHEQVVLIGLASQIRKHLAAPLPLGVEREIVQRLETGTSTTSSALAALTQLHDELRALARRRMHRAHSERDASVTALIVIGPPLDDHVAP